MAPPIHYTAGTKVKTGTHLSIVIKRLRQEKKRKREEDERRKEEDEEERRKKTPTAVSERKEHISDAAKEKEKAAAVEAEKQAAPTAQEDEVPEKEVRENACWGVYEHCIQNDPSFMSPVSK